MTTCRIRVTRDTPDSGAFEWVTLGREGEALASGAGNLSQPYHSVNVDVNKRICYLA